MDKKECCICGAEFTEWGNNALPVYEGICCDKCNYEVVIPIRIKNIKGEGEK